MLSANAARNLARTNEPSQVHHWLELAETFIKGSAATALLETIVDMHRNPNVQEEVEKQLEAEGYRVIRNEASRKIIIRWSK